MKLTPEHDLLLRSDVLFDILISMADEAVEQYRIALRAWSAQDLRLATELATATGASTCYYERLMAELMRLDGPDAVAIAMAGVHGGACARADRRPPAIIGARLRYLLTGDPAHLAAEVRWRRATDARHPSHVPPAARRGAARPRPAGGAVTEAIPRGTEVLLDGDLTEAQALIDGDDELDTLTLESRSGATRSWPCSSRWPATCGPS